MRFFVQSARPESRLPPCTRSAALGAALAVVLAVPATAHADGLTVQTKYAQSLEVDTNPLILPTGGQTLYGTVGMPELTLGKSSDDTNLSFDNLLDISRYNLPSYSSSDLHSTLLGKKSWELSYFSLTGKLDSDTTRTSEFDDSGVNVAGVRHLGISLAPEYEYSLSTRDQIVIDGSFANATYSNLQLYRNYLTYGVTPSYQHSFDPQDIGSLILQASHYNTTSGPNNSANSIGPAVGWQRKITPLITATVSGGYQLVKTNIAYIGSSTQFQSFYNLSVQAGYGLRDTLYLTSSRQVTPQSSGLLITQTSVNLSEVHRFTPLISNTVKVNFENDSYTILLPFYESSFLEASTNLTYDFTKRWSLVSSLRYRREERVETPIDGTSEAALLTLIYTPPLLDFE